MDSENGHRRGELQSNGDKSHKGSVKKDIRTYFHKMNKT